MATTVQNPPIVGDPPPPLGNSLWFDMNYGNDDVDRVMNFAWTLPQKLFDLFNNEGFRSLMDKEGAEFGVTSDLFFKSLEHAKVILFSDLDRIQSSFRNEINRNNFYNELDRIGFTGTSLQVKAGTLNMLGSKVTSPFGRIIDIAKKPLVKVVRKVLTCLNHLLGSLKYVIPGIEAIKEVKEVGENYLAVADEG